MRIQQNSRHGRNINTIFVLFLNLGCQLRIQTVNTLQNQNHVVFQPKFLPTLLTYPCLKIKMRQFHLLACQQSLQLTVEKRKIQSIERLEIIFSMLVPWRMLPIQKVIIQRYGVRFYPVSHQLNGQAFAECRLPTRRRTGYQYQFQIPPRLYFIRNTYDLLFL